MKEVSRKDSIEALKRIIHKASAGIGEDNTGAAMTTPLLYPSILRANWAEGTLYSYCRHFTCLAKSNGALLPYVSESKRTIADGILGGWIAYPVTEGATEPRSFPVFAQDRLLLNQVAVATRVTNAMIEDVDMLEQFLSKGMEEALDFYTGRYIMYGTGNTCNGVLDTSGNRATKTISVGDPLTVQNLKDMVGWYYGGQNGCWVMGRDQWQEVQNLYANTLPLQFFPNGQAILFGYPVLPVNYMDVDNIVLGDFSQFTMIEKPIRESMSEELLFLSNESSFRSIARINGKISWAGGVQTQDGNTVYPVVCGTA